MALSYQHKIIRAESWVGAGGKERLCLQLLCGVCKELGHTEHELCCARAVSMVNLKQTLQVAQLQP